MSGGVDSSTAAALLVEEGYEVIGVMLRLWVEPLPIPPHPLSPPLPGEGRGSRGVRGGVSNRCCTPEAVESARSVAALLDIPFYLLNVEERFKAQVVDPFVTAYAAGHTPNPCLSCNRHIRFGYLLRYALGLGADYLATGHYARVLPPSDGWDRYRLLRGVDEAKDQSYVLYMLGQEELSHVLFPLGGFTKAQVREMARSRGLPVAERAESQDLCFVGGDDYRDFLRRYAPQTVRPGPILDQTGRRLGTHRGLAFYTIGQRKGLGIAAGEPLYVLEIDVARNALIVGPESALGRRELMASEVSFVSGEWPTAPLRVTAKIRYRAPDVPATVWPLEPGRVRVVFEQPLRDITPGQGVVFYDGEVCLGGGIIAGGRGGASSAETSFSALQPAPSQLGPEERMREGG